MKALAKAAITGMFYLEMWPVDVIDPDDALKALQDINYHLQKCSARERTALAKAVAEFRAQEAVSLKRKNVLKFYDSFLENVGFEADSAE